MSDFLAEFLQIHVSESWPPGEFRFIVPRKSEVVELPSGERRKVWLETEEEWARKCGIIRGLKT